MQQQGKQINPKHVFDAQQEAIFNLTTSNLQMKAYIAQLEEENARLQAQLTEPPVEKPTE